MTGPQGASPELEKQILVAGVGNAWLQDDAFGAEVARRLAERELPSGVSVMDVGTSGLDLAYEVMRGYSALVIVDVSRQGGEPGTLYVIDVEPDDVPSEIEDGETIDPHSMDPMTMLRFVRVIGGWPGRVQVIACEPAEVDEVGVGLTAAVEAAVDRAIGLVFETIEELRTDAAYPAS
ncbi:MAG: hydrogenase maturation protease [Solirubrobacterales bacterium]|nr:hydrogenase maturation protease [Solirubrobacterales bacterium]